MYEYLVASSIFVCLVVASIGSLLLSEKLPAPYRHDDTHSVVRLAANIFVVAASLLLGLMLNSAKNTFEAVDRNIHAFATDLILLDRSLRQYGPEASDARERLGAYLRQAVKGTWGGDGAQVLEDRAAERLLDGVGTALAHLTPTDPVHADIARAAHLNFESVVRRRWVLIEESEGAIPAAFLVMLTAWLVLIFASFGYRAPRNAVVVTTLLTAAFLLAGSIYLMLDMTVPFSGPIKISPAPLLRAEEQMRR